MQRLCHTTIPSRMQSAMDERYLGRRAWAGDASGLVWVGCSLRYSQRVPSRSCPGRHGFTQQPGECIESCEPPRQRAIARAKHVPAHGDPALSVNAAEAVSCRREEECIVHRQPQLIYRCRPSDQALCSNLFVQSILLPRHTSPLVASSHQ